MSAPTKQQTARRPAQPQGKSRVTRYVDHQLEKTRRQVKSNDLIASILLLVVMVIGFLLLAAIVDAWVFTLTPLMRWAALLLLVTSCVVMMVFSIWPLLTKKINPDYAAKMLEDAKPGFRNSLLNYVWFRKKPEVIGGAVFDAVARQAAVDLHSVPDESTVDRSKVIRLGFWLVGVTAAMILYFMLSPKNPFQTFNRVMFPSADLAKPAVVTISDVRPGNSVVFFGDQVEITAKVYGPHKPEQVQLIYSTNDGRQSGQVRIMQPDPTTPRQYKLNLTENTGGLRESLVYEIVARDGRSGEFEIKIAPRPAITIESIQIDPPKYTKLKSHTAFQGAVDGVEGAKVTVRATANLEIDEATIELLNQLPTLPGEDQKFKLARTPKKMTVDSKNAKATFQLQLDTNREKPFATHYRLNFRSVDGKTPAAPNIYPIRIIPDLAPELEVRAPVEAESQVPANGALKVAAVASDVDYEISFVRIQVEHRGNQVLNERMPFKNQADQRQAQAQYVIRPEKLGLVPGDQAIFYITAGDNRTTYFSDTEPAPNLNRSKNYSFTVVEPNTANDEKRKKTSEPNPSTEENKPPEDNKDPKKDQSDSGDEGDTSDDGAGGSQEKKEPEAGDGSEDQPDSGDPSGENDPSNKSNSDEANEQKNESGDSGDSGDNSPEGSEDSGTKESDPQGAEGGEAKQDAKQESTDGGSGGSQTNEDGGDTTNKHDGAGTQQQPSDPNSAGDASNARPGNNPSDNATSQSAPETRDDNLTEGEQGLSKDASEAEQVREAEKFFNENPDREERQGDSSQTANQEGNSDPQGTEDEAGSGSSPDQKENPKDPSSESVKQDQGSSTSGDGSASETESQEAGDKEQDSSSQNPQNGNPNDSSEDNPSGNSAEQNPNNQKENNPSNGSDASSGTSSESSSSKSDDPESDNPGAGDKGDNSEQEKPGGKAGDEQSTDSSSGPPSGEQNDDQPKSGDESSGESSGESSSGDSSPSDSSPSDSSASEKASEPPSGQSPGGKKPSSGEPGQSSESGQPEQPGQPGQSGDPSDNTKPEEADGQEGSAQAGQGDVGKDALQRERENLEYSKKRIDFVLEKLRSQRHNPDKELLQRLGWDKQRLNDFIDSHDDMREAAKTDQKIAGDYERRLKSLGPPPNGQRRSVASNQEEASGLNQDSAVNQAPPNERHNFNMFLQEFQRVSP